MPSFSLLGIPCRGAPFLLLAYMLLSCSGIQRTSRSSLHAGNNNQFVFGVGRKLEKEIGMAARFDGLNVASCKESVSVCLWLLTCVD